MKILLKVAAALGLAAALAPSAQAQGFGRGMGGMGGGLNLLANKSVQKELKLTDEQIEKATAAQQEMGEKMRERFQDLQGLEGEERQEKMQAMMKEMAADAKKITDEMLKPEQQKRFSEISYQRMGFNAYADEDIQAKLMFTDEQKNKVKDMAADMQAKMMEMREEFQSDREGAMKKMTEMRKEVAEKAEALLTDVQKKSWKEMQGEPFAFVEEPRRRPGGN